MTKRVKNSKQQRIHPIFSHLLPKLSRYSLTVLLSVALISSSVGATPKYGGLQIAQQPGTQKDATRAAAVDAINQGWELFDQGTAESKRKAIEKWQQALKLWQQIDDKKWQALTLNIIGFVYNSLGEKQQALKYYNQALPLVHVLDDREREVTTLNLIGLIYDSLREKQQALSCYNQALPLSRLVNDKKGEATTLNNLGLLYSSWGEQQQALKYYNQALPLIRLVNDKKGEGTTLNNIGAVYDSLGEKQEALKYYNQALPLRRLVDDKGGEAITLNNLGLLYSSLGEQQEALKYYNQALPLRRIVGDTGGEANTLNSIGGVYDDLREKQKALTYYNQALPLIRAVEDKGGEAAILNNIGGVYDYSGEKQQALKYFNQALPLVRAIGDRRGEANTLNNIGLVYDSLGEKQQALTFYNQALPISRAVGDKGGEATTLYNIASLERDRGNLPQALTQIEAAIKIIEELRTKILNQNLRTSYFATVQGEYKFYIDLLMQLHKKDLSKVCEFTTKDPNSNKDIIIKDKCNALALHISERSHARSLLELLTEARADIRQGVDPKLLAEERSLQQQIDARKKIRIEIISGKHTTEQEEKINKEISELLDKYSQVLANIRANSPRYAALTQPQPLTLEQIQSSVLDDNTILLQYSLGKDRSYLWLVTKTGMKSYELPKNEDIEAAAKKFYQSITGEKVDPRGGIIPEPNPNAEGSVKVATKLSQMLLQPVAGELGNKRFLIVADGILQYIPFAALPNPTQTKFQPLLVEHEIVNAPSASTIAVVRNEIKNRNTAVKKLAVLADPVFNKNDDRVKSNVARGVRKSKYCRFKCFSAEAFEP